MTAFIHEPFYDFDRYFNSFLHDTPHLIVNRPRQTPQSGDVAVRALKPRYAHLSAHFGSSTHYHSFWLRRMDLHENTEANTVTATFEFPGFKKEDVQIDVHNGKLTVAAESNISSERKESGYTVVRERQYGRFSRTLQLPPGVKVSLLRLRRTLRWFAEELMLRMRKSKRRWRTGS